MAGVRLVRAAHHALVFTIVVGTMLVLSAQAVVDPRYVEFNASTDHNQFASDGITPLVSRYSLSIYPVGSASPFATVNLGKPAPNASGVIRVDFLPLLPVQPTPGVNYEARVSAVGPGGTVDSTTSNPFSYSAPCAPGITPTNRTVGAGAATGSVTVTVAAACAWSAVSNAGWITVTSGASGSGNGTVNYSVAANASTSQRVGTVTIAGIAFTVTQSGVNCSWTVSPMTASIGSSGGNGSTSVTSPAGCPWTAVSSATPWLTVTGGASGSGNGTVSYSVAANPDGLTRQGTLTIGGQAFIVDQAAAPCTYSISPGTANVGAAGATSSTTVTAPDGCAWTAVSSAPSWLAVIVGANGNGDGTVTFAADVNTQTQSRQGTITIGGRTLTVTQAAAACAYSIAPGSISIASGAAAGTTTVTAQAGCAWTAVTGTPAWLTVTGGANGSGTGTVSFSAAANTAITARAGTIAIAGQTFTVNQAAAGCTFSISPASASVTAAGGGGSIGVTAPAGCAWAAASGESWLTITAGASGSGNGTVSYSAGPNQVSQTRQGTITLGGQTFVVNQAASTCSLSISPTSMTAPYSGRTGSASVLGGTGCAWTAQSNDSWITVTSGATGSGNGGVTFSVAASTSTLQRIGTLTIAGRTLTVTQAANTGCQYALSSPSQTVLPGGGPATVTLNTTSQCWWTATSGVSWMTLNTFGSGARTLTFTVAPNTTGSTRTGQLTIAREIHTVTQPSGTTPAAPRSLRVVIAVNGGS